MSGWRALVACCVLSPLATGCSFAFVQPPSEQPPRSGQALSCTTGTLAPGLDVMSAALLLIGTGIVLNKSDEDYRDDQLPRPALIVSGVLLSALGLGSAIYGFNTTARCRAARDMEPSRARTRPNSRDVAAEIAEEEAAQARADALAAQRAKAVGETVQPAQPTGSSTDAGAPR